MLGSGGCEELVIFRVDVNGIIWIEGDSRLSQARQEEPEIHEHSGEHENKYQQLEAGEQQRVFPSLIWFHFVSAKRLRLAYAPAKQAKRARSSHCRRRARLARIRPIFSPSVSGEATNGTGSKS